MYLELGVARCAVWVIDLQSSNSWGVLTTAKYQILMALWLSLQGPSAMLAVSQPSQPPDFIHYEVYWILRTCIEEAPGERKHPPPGHPSSGHLEAISYSVVTQGKLAWLFRLQPRTSDLLYLLRTL